MAEIIYKKESYAIIGACFEVYNEKGCGFLEPVYQECLGIEFECQRIPSVAKPSLTLSYRGRILKQTYEPDYVCFEKIIVELKAISAPTDEHRPPVTKLFACNWLRAWLVPWPRRFSCGDACSPRIEPSVFAGVPVFLAHSWAVCRQCRA